MSSKVTAVILLNALALAQFAAEDPKPLFKDFMGINGHTIQFKPELYKSVCRLVRDYHPVEWDLGNDSAYVTTFPSARNRVDWSKVYGSWKEHGFVTDACLMFETLKQDKWKDIPRDARAYGLAFGKAFGPSSQTPLVSSVEIGNEPGSFDDKSYRALFEGMARGIREGDPKMTIATCALVVGKSHKYAKSVSCLEGLGDLYDALNFHIYAEVEGWPTWKRSYPEDPKIKYLKEVNDAVVWRDKNAPGKPLWITEFGWDASTKPAPKSGDFAKWQGSTETQQAQWLVRSFLVFAKMPVARAYIYFFNDKDDPHVHGSSGLTRDFKPKPAFYAVAHLYKTLGDYRFSRVIDEHENGAYVYEFTKGDDPSKRVWVAWSATNSERTATLSLPLNGLTPVKAEHTPLNEKPAEVVEYKATAESFELTIGETPIYIWLNK
jgi:hypothetical protein